MITTSFNPLGISTALPSHLTRLRGVGIGYTRQQRLIIDCEPLRSLELTVTGYGVAPGTGGSIPLFVGASESLKLWWVRPDYLVLEVSAAGAIIQEPLTKLTWGVSHKLNLQASLSGVYTRTIDDSADIITDLGAFFPSEQVSLGGAVDRDSDASKLDVETIRINGYDYIPALNTVTNRACVYDTRLHLEHYPNVGDLIALT